MKQCSVIALLSQKGGVGKTTVAMQLAEGLAGAGYRISVCDLDPQESAARWAAAANPADPFPASVMSMQGDLASLETQVGNVGCRSDMLLLDCPPSIEHAHTLAALELADVILIPVVPSPTDLWSTRAVERLVVATMARRPGLRAALLPNRVQRTALAGDVLEVLGEFTLPVVAASLAQRNAYAQSAVEGGSVYRLGRSAGQARDEVDRLVAAVLELTGETR
ncbi:chromosome partitioning protein ParA [Parazoarcus communis]|uniref:Chromosome partitioning protein ParA n=1 Tax=Parazoarcus communis TaxID=41977 RepID=A0A2U8GNN7_9RHOO|nr:ParA family partition ATPase [Parazoarcus communis]AWI74793.1 chromosome partitioning protein ParA [Parazoarcus communis]